MTEMFSLWFDDLEPGTRFEARGRTVTEADVVGFAQLTGDFHPLHTDAEWAAASRFGERVAHGLLAVSFAVGQLGFDPDRVVALRGVDDVRFKRPVPLDSTLTVDGTVESAKPLDEGHGLVTLRVKLKADGRLAVTARFTAVWAREVRSQVSENSGHPVTTIVTPGQEISEPPERTFEPVPL